MHDACPVALQYMVQLQVKSSTK